jgi:hypothetical protein
LLSPPGSQNPRLRISIRRRRTTGTLAPDPPDKCAPNREAPANAPPRRDSCARNRARGHSRRGL